MLARSTHAVDSRQPPSVTDPMPRRTLRFLSLLAINPATVASQSSLDWQALEREAVQLLSEYLQINTANPVGRELQGALFLKRLLEREGIEARILDTAELKPAGRANLYARLP